jgi:hypothetical protein
MPQMRPLFRRLPGLARGLAIVLLAAGVGLLVIQTAVGRPLVKAVYDGQLTPLLGDVLSGRSLHTVDHYHEVLAQRVPHLVTSIVALALALLCASRSSSPLPTAILAIDLVLIAVDATFRASGRWPGRFSVNMDGGYPEVFQYVKEAGIAIGLLVLYLRRRSPLYLVWSGAFFYLLLDDALQIHERLADRFAQLTAQVQLPTVLVLRARDIGELLVAGSVGGLILLCLAFAYVGAAAPDRRVTRALFALLGLLALVGVVLDTAASALASWWIGFLSDASEMLAITAVVWYVYRTVQEGPGPAAVAASPVRSQEPARRVG